MTPEHPSNREAVHPLSTRALEKTSEPRPVAAADSTDFRRLDVAANRFGPRIEEGIQQARESRREISPEIARCIGHVLGRAYGRESALADYGRTGEGTSLTLRDDYLALYNAEQTHPAIKEWIDWLGTYLVRSEGIAGQHRYMNEHLPPKLDRILVETEVEVNDEPQFINVPASLNSVMIAEVTARLSDLAIDQNLALQAFLSLPDVDASTPELLEAFNENFITDCSFPEDAGRELAELDSLEQTINDAVENLGLPDSSVTIDYGLIEEHIRETYDLVDWKGRVYVFQK